MRGENNQDIGGNTEKCRMSQKPRAELRNKGGEQAAAKKRVLARQPWRGWVPQASQESIHLCSALSHTATAT